MYATLKARAALKLSGKFRDPNRLKLVEPRHNWGERSVDKRWLKSFLALLTLLMLQIPAGIGSGQNAAVHAIHGGEAQPGERVTVFVEDLGLCSHACAPCL